MKIKSKNPVFSLIIPFFAKGKDDPRNDSLKQLLKSLPRRSDIEVIICTDRSTPPENLKKYLYGPSLEICGHENSAHFAGAARNRGLKKASGEFLIFADSDDLFLTDAIDQILNSSVDLFENSDLDMVMFRLDSFLDKKPEEKGTRHIYSDRSFENAVQENSKNHLLNIFVPYGRIIRRELVQDYNIKFGMRRVSNDLLFAIKTTLLSRSVGLINAVAYSIREGNDSLIGMADLSSVCDRIEEKHEANAILAVHNKSKCKHPLYKHISEIFRQDIRCAVKLAIVKRLEGSPILPQPWRILDKIWSSKKAHISSIKPMTILR
jgi:glycosyltransferase involved in cell wall biosynthesis